MYRFFALILSASVALLAAWQVYINLDEILDRWLIVIGFSAGTFVFITLVLYLPLLRHLADIVQDRFSAINQRFRARSTGLGLDEIPIKRASRPKTYANQSVCSICGGPGGPVCAACHKKMKKNN